MIHVPPKVASYGSASDRGDDITNASLTWPDSRTEIPFGTITLSSRVDDQTPERREIIFDPLPRVDGIDSSGDPSPQVRADIYLLSGQRLRSLRREGGREGLVAGADSPRRHTVEQPISHDQRVKQNSSKMSEERQE